jgi:hypothetical protein
MSPQQWLSNHPLSVEDSKKWQEWIDEVIKKSTKSGLILPDKLWKHLAVSLGNPEIALRLRLRIALLLMPSALELSKVLRLREEIYFPVDLVEPISGEKAFPKAVGPEIAEFTLDVYLAMAKAGALPCDEEHEGMVGKVTSVDATNAVLIGLTERFPAHAEQLAALLDELELADGRRCKMADLFLSPKIAQQVKLQVWERMEKKLMNRYHPAGIISRLMPLWKEASKDPHSDFAELLSRQVKLVSNIIHRDDLRSAGELLESSLSLIIQLAPTTLGLLTKGIRCSTHWAFDDWEALRPYVVYFRRLFVAAKDTEALDAMQIKLDELDTNLTRKNWHEADYILQ